MPNRQQQGPSIASFIRKDILLRAFFIALALGSVLTIANQSGAIFGDDTIQVLPLVLVYLTSFVVITVSQVLGLRRTKSAFGRRADKEDAEHRIGRWSALTTLRQSSVGSWPSRVIVAGAWHRTAQSD